MKRSGFRALLLGLCAACALWTAPAYALPADSGTLYPGIDVSVYQGSIDFEAVSRAGIRVVYIRAGQGNGYTDPDFPRSAEQARLAGLEYGFYYFVTAQDTDTAVAQARRFAGLIRGYRYTCRPVMDFERVEGMSAGQANAVALAFLEELERLTGAVPMVYTDEYNASRLWQQPLGRYPLWVAQYGPDEPTVTGDVWSAWSGFQYSSRGRVAGIDAPVDLDRFTSRVLLTQEEQPEPPAPPAGYVTYTVEPGDTLWAIARRCHTTVPALVEANGIRDPDLIYPGQQLRIPAGEDGTVSYTVRPGDTLWAIARSHATTVERLTQLNRLPDPDLIYPGQVLRLPAAP